MADRLLLLALAFPHQIRLHPAVPAPVPFSCVADGLGDAIAALHACDAQSPLSPVPGQLAALCASLDVSGHGITARPARNLPGPWLSMPTLDYLYLDASFFRMYPGSPAGPVLAAWGITTGGKPAFIGLAPGAGESVDAWHDFLQDLKDRGLSSPLLVISDGAPGLISAIEQAFPKGAASALLRASREKRPGQGPGRDAGRGQGRLLGPIRHRRPEDPARPPPRRARGSPHHRDGRPVRGDLPGGDEMPARRPRRAHRIPAVPAEHHHRIRHSNFIEQTFGETRRRTKVIGRLPGETSCLTLVWAVPDRASRGWRGLTMTADGLRLLQDLRRSLLEPPRQLRPRTATTRDDQRTDNVSATA